MGHDTGLTCLKQQQKSTTIPLQNHWGKDQGKGINDYCIPFSSHTLERNIKWSSSMSAFPVPLIQFLSGSLVAGVLFTSGYIGLLNDARSLGVNISELPEKSFQVIVFNGFWTIFAVLICISLIFSLYYLIHRATNRRLHQMVLSKWNKNDSDEKLIFKVLSLTILCCSIGLSSKAKFGNIVDKLLVLDKVDFVESAKTQINLDHQYLFVTINDYWIVLYDTNSKVTIRYPKSSIKSFSTKEPSVN